MKKNPKNKGIRELHCQTVGGTLSVMVIIIGKRIGDSKINDEFKL